VGFSAGLVAVFAGYIQMGVRWVGVAYVGCWIGVSVGSAFLLGWCDF
jgi:hypothetical protein